MMARPAFRIKRAPTGRQENARLRTVVKGLNVLASGTPELHGRLLATSILEQHVIHSIQPVPGEAAGTRTHSGYLGSGN